MTKNKGKQMEKAIKDYLYQTGYINKLSDMVEKGKLENKTGPKDMVDFIYFLITNKENLDDSGEHKIKLSEFLKDNEIGDIKMIMRDHKINMVLNNGKSN